MTQGRIRAALVGVAIAAAMLPAAMLGEHAAAADTYLDKCAVCHGADGAGKTAKGKKLKVKDVRETAVKVTAEKMAEVVKNGKSPDMDAYGKELSADQIKQVVDYYRGLAVAKK